MKKLSWCIAIVACLAVVTFVAYEKRTAGNGLPLGDPHSTSIAAQVTQAVSKLPGAQGESPFNSDLTAYVPRDASTLAMCDLKGAPAKAYLESPLFKRLKSLVADPEGLTKLLDGLPVEQYVPGFAELRGKAEKTLKVLRDNASGFSFEMVKSYAYFERPGTAPDQAPHFGQIILLENDLNLAAEIGQLKDIVEFETVSVDDRALYAYDLTKMFRSLPIAEGLSTAPVRPVDINSFLPPIKLYFGTANRRLAVSTESKIVADFLNDVKPAGDLALLLPDYFKTTTKALAYDGTTDYCYRYVDYQKSFGANLDELKKKLNTSLTPENERIAAPFLALLDEMPLRGQVTTQGYQDGLFTRTAISFEPTGRKYDLQKFINVFLTKIEKNSLLDLMPAEPLWAYTIQGHPIVELKNLIIDMAPMLTPQVKDAISRFDVLRSLGVSLKYVPGEAMFPELNFVLAVDKSDETFALLRDSSLQAARLYLPGANWIEKDIDGSKTIYLTSPFGVGIFLSHVGNNIFVSSSEVGLRRVLNIAAKKEESLGTYLTRRKHLSGNGALAFSYINFQQITVTLEAMSSMLGALNGSQFHLPEEFKNAIDLIGEISMEGTIESRLIRFNAVQHPLTPSTAADSGSVAKIGCSAVACDGGKS